MEGGQPGAGTLPPADGVGGMGENPSLAGCPGSVLSCQREGREGCQTTRMGVTVLALRRGTGTWCIQLIIPG